MLRKILTLSFCIAAGAAWSAPVRFASKNIDWGEIAQENVSRSAATPASSPVAKVSFASAAGAAAASSATAAPVIETRTITLDTGTKLRISERIEPDGNGGEDRIFVRGEQMNELSVVVPESSLAAVLDFLRARGLPIVKRYGRTGRIMKVRVPQDSVAEVEALLSELAAIDGVSAERNQIRFFVNQAERSATQPALTPSATPNDPFFAHQWGLQTIGAPEVWANGFYGYPNIPCAVFDTGVLLSHEDLQINVRQAVSALNSDPNNPNDHHGHGSHCLGIMGADGNNGKGICGVGQVANLTSIRGPISYWQEGDDINDGFQWALDHGIKILSCSFGTPAGQGVFIRSEYEMFEELKAAGILVVIAAGNDANNNDILPAYPASYDNDNLLVVVAVGQATNPQGQPIDATDYTFLEPASFSSFGAESCDIGAPGVNILSCTRAGDQAYEAWDGTSMATPMVAACAAMVWEQNPSWSYLDVKNRLMATATRHKELVGYCQTAGCVNLAAAMAQTSTIALADLPQKLYEVGATAEGGVLNEAVSLAITVSNDGATDDRIHAVRVSLLKTRDPDFISPLAPLVLAVPQPDADTPQKIVAPVWTPTVADAGRGYSFKVEGLDRNGQPVDVFCFSTVFRVQDRAHPEEIRILSPAASAGQSVTEVPDAGNFTITFTASAADWVQLTLQEMGPIWDPDLGEDGDYIRDENGDYVLDWVDAATLGLIRNENPGSVKYATVQLKGRGWNAPDEQYRVKAVDMDLSAGEGAPTYSCPFTFRHSSCSVWLMPGDPSAAAVAAPREHLGDCSQTWKADDWTWSATPGTVKVGEEVRITCWLPETSVYWLLLRDEETGGAFLMKQIEHSQIHPGYQKLHTFGLTIPTHIGDSEVVGRAYRLMLVDAFATEMRHFMPVPFTLVGEAEPTFADVFGDATGREYETSGFWYPVNDPKAADGKSLKCAWVGAGESAWFQTTVTGPVRMTFKVRGDIPSMNSKMDHYHFGFTAAMTTPPVLDYKQWEFLAGTQFAGSHADGWTSLAYDIPAGTHLVRFLYQRDDAALTSGCANSLWIDDITFTTITTPITITINESGSPAQASYTGGPAFPGFVTYTIDGTDPTADSPRWVKEQRLPLMLSTTIKARAFNPGCTPSAVASKVYVRLEKDSANRRMTIRTAADLVAFAQSVTAGNDYAGWTITLANDIDMTGVELPAIGTFIYDSFATSQPAAFRGTFDAGGHTLIAPTLVPSSRSDYSVPTATIGFVGCLDGGTVRNLTLLNPVMPSSGNLVAVGFIVAVNFGTVENCHVINGQMGIMPNMHFQWNAKGGIIGTNGYGDGKVNSSSFTGFLDGSTTPTTIGTPPPTPVFLPAPVVTPGSRPYSDPLAIRVTSDYKIEVVKDGGAARIVDAPYTETLNDRQHHTFQFRAVEQGNGETRYSPPVIASYGYYTKPAATGLMIGLFNDDGSIIPASNGSLCPPLEKFGICASGFFADIETRLAYDRTWTIRYTLDGTEPTPASLRYEPGVPFTLAGASVSNGKVTIKAKAFHDLYAAGATATTIIELQHDETTDVAKLGLLKIINGRQTAGQYQCEDFTIVANPPPPSHRFSHWRVVGPLVLTNAKRKEITFRFTFTEPITLEAIYEPAPFVLSVQ